MAGVADPRLLRIEKGNFYRLGERIVNHVLKNERSQKYGYSSKKILVAIDRSGQSLDAVRYVSKVIAPQNMKVTLFHVQRKIDEAFWEVGINPSFSKRVANIGAWELEQERAVNEFMDYSHQILLDARFTQEAVKVNIHQAKIGIARDIIKESITATAPL